MPDGNSIGAKWRELVEKLAELPKSMTADELERTRRGIKGLLGEFASTATGRDTRA